MTSEYDTEYYGIANRPWLGPGIERGVDSSIHEHFYLHIPIETPLNTTYWTVADNYLVGEAPSAVTW